MPGKKALVLGCGASGLAMVRFLHAQGWTVAVGDTRAKPAGAEELAREFPDVVFTGGKLPVSLADGIELLCLSPGLSPEHSSAAPLVAAARAAGVDVVGEIELFARELQRLRETQGYHPIIVGITGTNGKTTTTTLCGLMQKEAGRTVCVAGNIGPNVLTELMKAQLAASLPQAWVLELSSFQLYSTSSLECDAAAFLNLTEDHVDWHGSMAEYGAAKMHIFHPETRRVLNRGDAFTMKAAQGAAQVQTFGEDAPTQPGQWGLVDSNGLKWLAMMPAEDDAQVKLLMPLSELKIRGLHNAMNALAALALSTATGVPLAAGLRVLQVFKGLPHRVQLVLTTKGVEFIEDSKGTNVGSVIAALRGLGGTGLKSSIILGGDGKGQDFAPLADVVAKYASHVTVVGRDGPAIAEALKSTGVAIDHAGMDFNKAIELAYQAAKPGEAVLLSPACASWDMFPNYAVRAQQFVDKAHAIAKANGDEE